MWTKDEIAHLENLESSLTVAESQLNATDESIATQARFDVRNIKTRIREHKMSARDRVVIDFFSQKEFRDKRNGSKIHVIIVGNKCQEQHMLGEDREEEAILSIHQTGIKELRAFLCVTPSTDRVRAFVRRSEDCINKLRCILIWADGTTMPPRDAAMEIFKQHTDCKIKEHKTLLNKGLTEYRRFLATRCVRTWEELAGKKTEEWIEAYSARTLGVFIRQGGRHSPQVKGQKNKTQVISLNEGLLMIAEDGVSSQLKSIGDVVDKVERGVCENVRNTLKKIIHGLKALDAIGGANLDDVFKLFEDERDLCIRDVGEGMKELMAKLR